MDGDREQLVLRTLVELADTLVAWFDVVDLAHLLTERAVAILGVDAAGLMLNDPRRGLQVTASSDDRANLLLILQLQNQEGPCFDCCHSGEPVVNVELDVMGRRWPVFGPAAHAAGYRAVHAFPMRLRDTTVGALTLFGCVSGRLGNTDADTAQSLADMATIGILHERAVRDSRLEVEQLKGALKSRVLIEQAKGLLVERGRIGADQAFRELRGHAREHNRRLVDVAQEMLDQAAGGGGRSSPPRAPAAGGERHQRGRSH